MSEKPKRITTYLRTTGQVYRELHKIGRNEQNDIMLSMDGGEVWQFTPNTPPPEQVETPTIKRIGLVAQGDPFVSYIELENPPGAVFGDIRVLPRAHKAEPAKPKRVKRTRRGKEHDLDGHDIWKMESIIKNIVGGKQPKGTPPLSNKKVVKELLKRAKEHPLLKDRTMPGGKTGRTLEGWVAMVLKGRHLPGAIPGTLK